jgi:tetratricopeptide (TPR) repeat protein
MPRGEPSYVQHTVYTDHWIRRARGGAGEPEKRSGELVPMQDFWNDSRMKEEREGIAHVAYAIFSGNQANLDRGLELLSNVAMRGTIHREGWRRLGMGAMLRGEARLAANAFDRAVQAYPDDAALRMGLGSALHSVGDRKRALAELTKATQLSPGMLEPYIEAASIYAELQQSQKACELLENSLSRYPYQAPVLTMLGMLYYQFVGDTQRGMDYLRRASKLDPDNLQLRFTLAMAFMDQNEPDAAREHLDQALRIGPQFVPALLAMARLHILRQEKTQATERLQQVLRLDPNNRQAQNILQELDEDEEDSARHKQ